MKKIMKKAVNILKYFKCLCLYYTALAASPFLKKKTEYSNLWLISERGADARDNGYHFFRYLRQNHKEINCVYVIKRNCPDYEKIRVLGKTAEPGTFRHYLYFACAKYKVSTHIMGYAPDSYRFAILDRIFGIVKGKKVFLQHGIIKDDIAELHYPKVRLDMFVCSTIPEYNSVIEGYNFPDGIVKRIGLCRYDNLLSEHEIKRQILVMPTWRYYLRDMSENDFKNSEYYTRFNGLINDEKLVKLLEEHDFEIAFYLHYELQQFSELFSCKSPRVRIKSIKNSDVQELLMESAMLITDYSSVFFDFAYMKKPLLYWMFDRKLFFSEQYGEGYFKFEEAGFGPVFSKSEDVVDYIKRELENGMELEEKYQQRISDTFSDFSDNHCQKTYEAISKL